MIMHNESRHKYNRHQTILTESALCLVCSRLLPLAPPHPLPTKRGLVLHMHIIIVLGYSLEKRDLGMRLLGIKIIKHDIILVASLPMFMILSVSGLYPSQS